MCPSTEWPCNEKYPSQGFGAYLNQSPVSRPVCIFVYRYKWFPRLLRILNVWPIPHTIFTLEVLNFDKTKLKLFCNHSFQLGYFQCHHIQLHISIINFTSKAELGLHSALNCSQIFQIFSFCQCTIPGSEKHNTYFLWIFHRSSMPNSWIAKK